MGPRLQRWAGGRYTHRSRSPHRREDPDASDSPASRVPARHQHHGVVPVARPQRWHRQAASLPRAATRRPWGDPSLPARRRRGKPRTPGRRRRTAARRSWRCCPHRPTSQDAGVGLCRRWPQLLPILSRQHATSRHGDGSKTSTSPMATVPWEPRGSRSTALRHLRGQRTRSTRSVPLTMNPQGPTSSIQGAGPESASARRWIHRHAPLGSQLPDAFGHGTTEPRPARSGQATPRKTHPRSRCRGERIRGPWSSRTGRSSPGSHRRCVAGPILRRHS